MRELKFRAWDKLSNAMYYGYLPNTRWYSKTGFIDIDICNTDEIIIMQYTGLKDKNGKEIYECDIVRAFVETNYGIKKWEEFYYIVEWDESGYWKLMRTDRNSWIHAGHFSDLNYIEIIGNIYENQELLK